mmetsp:Transcript_4637/g.7135  ORF Transcript_4637/g.7135 Transcript_4637/m.7135 type:complete len:1629 (-) Transcript_4637:94-4980(-)
MPLPSLKECQSTLSNCLADSSPSDESIQTWRQLVQRCLSHGTSYDDHLTSTSYAGVNSEDLTSRSKEAGGVLSDSIEWYLRQWWSRQQQNNTSGGSDHDNHELQKQLKDDKVICAVVESLWLVGCLLDTEEDNNAAQVKKGEGSSGDKASKVPYQCLVNIIKDLTSSRNWMANDKDGDDAMDTNENSQPLIPIVTLQTTLELSLLQSANLLPNPPPTTAKAKAMKARAGGKAGAAADDTPVDFVHKKLKKMNTDMYYRQHKFNLLAEESEGYAKLLSFFIVGINEVGTGEEEDASKDLVSKEARKYVRELIGAFDLDPNRVLDLALDALEWELNEIMTSQQSKKSSSRNGANDEWGFDAINTAMSNVQSPKVVNTLLAIIGELDGNSNTGRAIAHLLGFKYRSYHNRAAKMAAVAAEKGKDGKDTTDKAGKGNDKSASTPTRIYPRSLFISTAFLSAHGLVDLHNLLPHLNSTLNLIDTYKTHTTTTINRLKKLGVVSLNSSKAEKKNDKDDTAGNESAARDAAFQNDPVIGLFRAFLAMGDGDRPAAFLAHATVPEFDSAVKDGDGDKMFSAMELAVLAACSLSESVGADVCAWVASMIKNISNENGNSGTSTSTSRASILPLLNSPFPPETSLSEISSVLRGPLSSLSASGAIRLAQPLYIKLCRLYNKKLVLIEHNVEVDIKCIDDNTMSVLSTFMVPSLSLFPSDTLLPKELWSLLKKLPYTLRYSLYSAWRKPGLEKGTLRSMLPKDIKSGKIPKPLGNIESEIETGIAARYVLKRISKENIKDMGRQLSKTSHNNPLVVFSDILAKIESYDNLILMMVDTFQFATELSLDVMGYCLLLSLGGGDGGGQRRSGTKMGGLNTEQWLASLETFTGAFYKKFPDVELRGILVYLTSRFRDGESSELGVLRSLIKTAGGYGFVDYDSTASLSDLQLDGRCGSRLLKRETSSFGVVDNINRKASQHLRAVLQGGDLGVMMILLLSQMRLKILYTKAGSDSEHVKVIGNTYDDCEAVLCLLLEFLSDSSDDQASGSSTKEKFAASMPSLEDLHSKYGLDAAVAWMLCRPLIRKSMFFKDDDKLAGNSPQNVTPGFLKRFAASPEMTTSCEKLLPQGAWKNLSPTLFQTFYSLSIYDILCPEERYNIEIGRLKKEVERLTILQKGGEAARGQMSALAAAAAAAGANANEVRQATTFTIVHREELDRLKRNVDQLNRDFQRQQKRCKFVMSMLESQKKDLIRAGESDGTFASAFMTFCVYPRCFLSPEDSLFCAQFIKVLHSMKLQGFSTIELIDNIVNAAIGSLYCMTEDEAGNLAIFLNEIWKSVNSWRYNNDAFSSELKGSPGSKLSKAYAEANNIGDHSVTDGITHDDFKAIYTQWHSKIGVSSIGCLASSEYMHTRAALIVLSRIVLVYPTQPKVGDKILKSLSSLQSEDNPRPDIRATAQGYHSQLTKARDDGMWKEENIAVTRARQEKEKAKAEERKKNLALQHENMKKESEAITREIGDGDRYGRDRRDDRGRPDDRGRAWGADPRAHQQRGPPMNGSAPVFTPKVGAQRELGFADRRERGGHERDVYVPPNRRDGPVTRRQEDGRGGGRKRSRSPDRGDDSEHQQSKRTRGEWAPPRRSARR